MKSFVDFRNKLIENNRKEFGVLYDQLRKINYYRAVEAEDERLSLLESLHEKLKYEFNQTKPYAYSVSPGCRLCGAGEWSCLFINNRCNCHCFYCPVAQTNDRLPETQGLSFSTPEPYIAYLQRFGFKGASISGGEPLLSFDLTLDFITKIKRTFGDQIYLWLYTNGKLLTESMAGKMANAGLDEIRFDLSATSYNTRFLKKALRIIPHVTVEIPAIPEDFEKLKKAVRELEQLNVSFLNLHEMRLTPFNLNNLVNRNYTFRHGYKMTVLESEMTSLKILQFVLNNDLQLPVNYCSFHYKNHFQKAGFRRKFGEAVLETGEEITANGYIRKIAIEASNNEICGQMQHFSGNALSGELVPDHEGKRIIIKKDLLGKMTLDNCKATINYFTVQLSDRPVENSIMIFPDNGKPLYLKRMPTTSSIIVDEEIREDVFGLMNGCETEAVSYSDTLFSVALHEIPAKGMGDYF